MKNWPVVFLAAFILFSVGFAAHAQTIVVTQPYVGLSDKESANVVIRERRSGPKTESAEIDFCFQATPNGALDRAVFELTPRDGKLAGSGVTERTKTPIEFSYSAAYKGDQLGYTGVVKVGSRQPVDFKAEYVSENTEKQYRDTLMQIALVERPTNFTMVSPQWVAISTRTGTMPALIAYLRGQNVLLDALFGLVEDCDALRSGTQTIQLIVAPSRAEAVIAGARKLPGVVTAGWGGLSPIAYAARIPAAPWSNAGTPDRKKLEAVLARIVARSVEGTFSSAAWDETTGDLVLKFKRASQFFPGLGFSESIEVALLAENERPGPSDHIVVRVNSVKALLVDETGAGRLKFRPLHEIGGEGLFVDQEPIAQAIARELKGVTWDALEEKWSR